MTELAMTHLSIRLAKCGGVSIRIALLILVVGALMACARGASTDNTEPLLVAAAASLEAAFSEVGAAYTDETGQPVEFVYGSSGNLATQIENGAPFDVYASADEEFVNQIAAAGLVLPGTQAIYAQGTLVLAVNIASGLEVNSLDDLAGPGVTRLSIANPELAPYGRAAQQALQASGLWDELKPKIVQGANVRQALQYVQTGDAPVGLIALSIASVPEVRFTPVDAGLHDPLNQALAVVSTTDQEAAARSFAEFALGSQGQSILNAHGFTSPGSP